jgi:hypothetical protein
MMGKKGLNASLLPPKNELDFSSAHLTTCQGYVKKEKVIPMDKENEKIIQTYREYVHHKKLPGTEVRAAPSP